MFRAPQFDLFIQDLRDFRESNAQALTTKDKNLTSYCEGTLNAGRQTTQLIRDMLQSTRTFLPSQANDPYSFRRVGPAQRYLHIPRIRSYSMSLKL